MSALRKLVSLDASFNKLPDVGDIPRCFSLQDLRLASNALSAASVARLGGLTRLTVRAHAVAVWLWLCGCMAVGVTATDVYA